MSATDIDVEPLTLTTAQVHSLTKILERCRCGTASEEVTKLIAQFFSEFRAAVRAHAEHDRVAFFVHRAHASRYWQILEATEASLM